MPIEEIDPFSIARDAAMRLVRCQLSSGAVIYKVDAASGLSNNSAYNMVRMAGVAYSLGWAAALFADDAGVGASLLKAWTGTVAFLTFSCELQRECYCVGEYSFESGPSHEAKLGATSLLALALIVSPCFESYAEPAAKLIATIRSCQTKEGAFRSLVTNANLGSQRYASGEALLALVRYFEKTGDATVLPDVERAFFFYRRYYDFDPHPGFILWHVDCWARMAEVAQLPIERRMEYRSFAQKLADVLLAAQIVESPEHPERAGGICFGSQPGISTSLYMEALARVSGIFRRAGQTEQAERYGKGALRALAFVKRLQIKPGDVLPLSNTHLVAGGMRNNLGSPVLRMDNDQHAITACLAMTEERLAGGMSINVETTVLDRESLLSAL